MIAICGPFVSLFMMVLLPHSWLSTAAARIIAIPVPHARTYLRGYVTSLIALFLTVFYDAKGKAAV
jgi:hypothetical protein